MYTVSRTPSAVAAIPGKCHPPPPDSGGGFGMNRRTGGLPNNRGALTPPCELQFPPTMRFHVMNCRKRSRYFFKASQPDSDRRPVNVVLGIYPQKNGGIGVVRSGPGDSGGPDVAKHRSQGGAVISGPAQSTRGACGQAFPPRGGNPRNCRPICGESAGNFMSIPGRRLWQGSWGTAGNPATS